ncbi:tripartite tricarboxylate transporter substrate-binding protein [Sediminicoccus sp. KRV36]|uniref:Bug family tripartite tricarboxylate transporter substrate binding protein n=1 Tax=Sediminicoccus sp. KRV36 TaxID=3133721 RepID=UPI0020106D29|nr:tripartite tricarboxylate transporter substrate-binding protein [Sediminicoccus rosea]UPY36116.1 tripartite tricarboxylate transporter substrate binding protein [Sediminicoccus rosea]
MIHRRSLLAAPALLPAALLPGPARAQGDWPTRPITMMIPFVAGGPSDITGRVIAARMGGLIGGTVVVENRPGANGAVAAQAMARAAPDGHTLMTGSIGVYAINKALRPNLPYDPVRDFAPITLAVTTPNVLVINPAQVPATDYAGTLAWLRANAARASYSTSGVGSSEHMTMELFKLRTQTEATHIPYQGGAAAATALIAGDVQLTFQNLGTVAPHIAGGRLRAVMVTSATRNPTIPDVPTAAELGLEDFVVTSWQAVMAPVGVPAPILARMEAACIESLRHPEATQRLNQIGFEVVASSAGEFRRFQEAELTRWRAVVERAQIRAE